MTRNLMLRFNKYSKTCIEKCPQFFYLGTAIKIWKTYCNLLFAYWVPKVYKISYKGTRINAYYLMVHNY